jgi:hypothetical protein
VRDVLRGALGMHAAAAAPAAAPPVVAATTTAATAAVSFLSGRFVSAGVMDGSTGGGSSTPDGAAGSAADAPDALPAVGSRLPRTEVPWIPPPLLLKRLGLRDSFRAERDAEVQRSASRAPGSELFFVAAESVHVARDDERFAAALAPLREEGNASLELLEKVFG